jgi:hypothetical protein
VIQYGKFTFVILLGFLSLLSACSQPNIVIPTATSSASITPQTRASPINSTNTFLPTLPKTLTPSLLPKAICPQPDTIPAIHEAETEAEAEQYILDYLNQGGSPEKLQKELPNLGTILDTFQVFIKDVNNDGANEILIATNFHPPEGGDLYEAEGKLSLYDCIDDAYKATNIIWDNPENINIIVWEDLLGSEIPEILVKRQAIYMSGGCDEYAELYSQTQKGWVSSFTSDFSGCGMKIDLKVASDGQKELLLEGQRGCSYLSCGPWRGEKWTYKFLNNKVELVVDMLLPSPYRIHLFEDGDIAIEKGDLETAVGIYDKAARDDKLIDVLTINEKDKQVIDNIPLSEITNTAHAYQTSFSYFREFVLLLYLKRDDDALTIFNTMKNKYPDNTQGSEFVDLSSYLLEKINAGIQINKACGLTNDYLAEKYILGTNNFLYSHLLGYGDLSHEIGEILCPVIEIK